jgi:hypothetical protein
MRRICVALFLVVLAGCGNSEQLRTTADDPPPAAAPPKPSTGAGGGTAGGGAAGPEPLPDPLARRLGRLCAKTKAKIADAPDAGGNPDVVAKNADLEIKLLGQLKRDLESFPIDDDRREALRQYLAALRHEMEVDGLIATAARADDDVAVDDLNVQNAFNRRARKELAEGAIGAGRCKPAERITD